MLKSIPLLIITLAGVQLQENSWNYHCGKYHYHYHYHYRYSYLYQLLL